MQVIPSLYIAVSRLGGRGVFTSADISEGSIIEVSPAIVMPKADREYLDKTGLYDYYFIWGKDDHQCAIVLGYGSMYNHAYEPNAEYSADYEANTLDFFALRNIKAGEEITVNYNGNPEEHDKLWFKVKKLQR